MRFILLIFLGYIGFLQASELEGIQYQQCDLVDRFDLHYHKMNLLDSCNGNRIPKFIHAKSLVKNPEIDLLISSYKTKDHGALNIRVNLNLSDECDNLDCIQNLDLKQIILENEKYKDQIKAQLKEQDLEFSDESLSFSGRVSKIDLHPGTPLFNEAPTEERMEEAIFGDIYGTLDPEFADKYPEEQMAYKETAAPDEEIEDFEWDDDIFSEEEIAEFEAEAAKEDQEQNPQPEIKQPESGVQLGIATPRADFEEIVISETEIVRVPEDVETQEETAETLPEAFTVEAVESEWNITPYGKRNDEIQFYLENNGQKFDVNSNELEMLSGFNGMIENIRIDNNTVYFTVMGMGEMQLAGSVKKQEDELPENDQEQTVQVNQCINSLGDFVKNGNNDEVLSEFMAIQGKLTMHRLAWAQLNTTSPKEKIEENILKLIQEKYQDKYEALASEFDSVPKRSRNFLAKAVPIVKDVLNEQANIDATNKQAYLLNIGDLKMLEIAAEYEAVKGNKYDARMFNSGNISNSMINFATVINSSYQRSQHKLESNQDVLANKDLLSELLPKLEANWKKQLLNIIYSACYEPEGLSCKQAFDSIDRDMNEDLDAIMAALMNNVISRNDESLVKDNKYEKLWLKVAH